MVDQNEITDDLAKLVVNVCNLAERLERAEAAIATVRELADRQHGPDASGGYFKRGWVYVHDLYAALDAAPTAAGEERADG